MSAIELEGWEELSRQLDRVDDRLTNRTKLEAVKAGGSVVASRARQLCPVGDPADKPDLKPLRETIAVEVRDYGDRALAVIGPQYPAGAHGHLVEHGHATANGGRTRPRPFVRPAFDETQDAQQAAMQSVVDETMREFGG